MAKWLKRFGLHLAAAVGATGIFLAAASVGANQTRQQPAAAVTRSLTQAAGPPSPAAQRKPSAVAGVPPATSRPPPSGTPGPTKVLPERSLAGTIRNVLDGELEVVGIGGREWRVTPYAGALIRLNGKNAPLAALQPGDTVVILGQTQAALGNHFSAHAITARRK